jgi:SagB-type dehydrogenase family enzyme
MVKLPEPQYKGTMSVEEAISLRQSVRRFKHDKLTMQQLSQLLWAAQGKVSNSRTVPSAGTTYPLQVYIAAGINCVEGLESGVYLYHVETHSLLPHLKGDKREQLSEAAMEQDCVLNAPLDIVVCASYIKTTEHYGERGTRYVHMEAGHLGQNVSLQAVALGMGSVMVGAFNDNEVSNVLSLEGQIKPLYIIPVGVPR